MNAAIWTAIGALAAAFYTLAFFFSLRMLARQLRAQSFAEAYERIQDEDVRSARRVLYKLDETNVGFENWKTDDAKISAAEKVCQRYDYFAKMVRYKFLPKKLILRDWAWQVERLWRVVKPFVQSRRTVAGQGRLWEDFQWFARESSKWMKKKGPVGVLPTD